MSNKKNLLITGGAGFIGSHLVIHLAKKYSNYRIINVDSLTYASNLKNLAEIQNSQNYIFEKIDIRDKNAISQILIKYEIDNKVLANFKYAFAITINKAQGSTIDEKFMVWDWYKMGFSTNLKYTAVSRATKSEDVKVCSKMDELLLDRIIDGVSNEIKKSKV